ncbi:MAG: glutaminyl-peptide cyclotransferase [Dehalogenimonas sp.]
MGDKSVTGRTVITQQIQRLTVAVCLIISFTIVPAACNNGGPPNGVSTTTSPAAQIATHHTYRIVNSYPHDRTAFTQGLVYFNGFLYESTGLNGQSSIRKVELATGKVMQSKTLPQQYFGEGLTMWQDTLIQLTWQSGTGFVYDLETFDLENDFNYVTEGWGLTNDGNRIIMSDGTANIYFIDPVTLQQMSQVEVKDGTTPVVRLNELEYIEGKIYANVWQTDRIAIIDPVSGRVEGWIDLTGLLTPAQASGINVDVLNGIAYDAAEKRLFVTGKFWPLIFEIQLVAR